MAESEVKSGEEKGKKTRKKRRPFLKFLGALILLGGALFGLHASGAVDLRPFVFTAVPRIPFVGGTLASSMNIPEVYSFTPEQRRRIELEEWETSIAQRVRSLDNKEQGLSTLSDDLAVKQEDLDQAQRDFQKSLDAQSADLIAGANGAAGGDSAEVKRLLRTFEEMSPRNAAAILEKTSDQLAVTLLARMGEDVAAKILARMQPARAANLAEALALTRQ